MSPAEYYTEDEVKEIMFKIGDIIMDVNLADKLLEDKFRTAWFALQTAHSMLSDLLPEAE